MEYRLLDDALGQLVQEAAIDSRLTGFDLLCVTLICFEENSFNSFLVDEKNSSFTKEDKHIFLIISPIST